MAIDEISCRVTPWMVMTAFIFTYCFYLSPFSFLYTLSFWCWICRRHCLRNEIVPITVRVRIHISDREEKNMNIKMLKQVNEICIEIYIQSRYQRSEFIKNAWKNSIFACLWFCMISSAEWRWRSQFVAYGWDALPYCDAQCDMF